MFYRLEWMDRKGGFHSDQGSFTRLARKLETLRSPADLWIVDENGCKIQTVGGCDRIEEPKDKRYKWRWWHDKKETEAICRSTK